MTFKTAAVTIDFRGTCGSFFITHVHLYEYMEEFSIFGRLDRIAMEQQPILNEHNKAEFEPAHTPEHILNATMVKMFGCPRSRNAHMESDSCLSSWISSGQVSRLQSWSNPATPHPHLRTFIMVSCTCNPPQRFNWRLMFWLDPADNLPTE